MRLPSSTASPHPKGGEITIPNVNTCRTLAVQRYFVKFVANLPLKQLSMLLRRKYGTGINTMEFSLQK